MSEIENGTQPPESSKPQESMRSRRWFGRGFWGLLLIVSLGFNLFFGGLILGRFVGAYGGHSLGPPPLVRGPGAAFDGLGGEHRKRAYRHLDDRTGELRERSKELAEARRAVGQALVSEPFDKEALEQAFANLRMASDATQTALHTVIVNAAEGLPAKERSALLKGISGRGSHRGHDRN